MSGQNNLSDKLHNRVQKEFKDHSIEYQLMAYIVRKNPVTLSSVQRIWFSDLLLHDIYGVMSESAVVMSKAMLWRALKDSSKIGKGEKELYLDCVNRLFKVNVEQFTDKSVSYLTTQVLKLYESRRVLIGVGKILADIKSFDLDKSKSQLLKLGRPVVLHDPLSSGHYLDDYGQRLDALEDKKARAEGSEAGSVGIPTGIYRFDKLCGGLLPTEFGVIAGITGIGKTAALICFALSAWELGYNVMIASGEMSKVLMEFRIDSHLAGIDGKKFRLAELDKKDYSKWDTTIKKYKALNGNVLYIVTFPRRFTTENVEHEVIKVQEETGKKLDWLGLDYLNIMESIKGSRQSGMGWESQADVVWDVKGLTADYNMVTWTANQVKDEAFDKSLFEMSDLKYARAIPEAAPVVVALVQDKKDMLAKRMKLQILKMRNAPPIVKPIILTPNLNMMKIHEEIRLKTLSGKGPDTLNITQKKRSSRPMRSYR